MTSHLRLCLPLPLGVLRSGLWFPFTKTGVLQQGRGPLSSDMLRPGSLFQSADCRVGEDHSVPLALKGSALSCPCGELSSGSSWEEKYMGGSVSACGLCPAPPQQDPLVRNTRVGLA